MKDPKTSYALMLLVISLMTVGALIYGLSPTGYAVLDAARVYADKETYTVGDMAHITVFPDDAGYSIEVYGPDDKLAAVSTDFPVEKLGEYRIEALITSGNETKKVSSTFNAAEKEAEKAENNPEQVNQI
ncbi:MAG: hypothetical protein NT001_01265, partial [Candidatus Woesearchaeota archaeon]|nr:hypothetical protein [Candidatus Woesearchaeota archaeon]